MALNTKKWTLQLKMAYLAPLLGPHQAAEKVAPIKKEILHKRSTLENFFPTEKRSIQLEQEINALQSFEYLFAEIQLAGRKTKTPRPGKRLPPQEFLELVVIGIELAKGDSTKLHEIRVTLQDSNSRSVPPAKESVFSWTKTLPAHERFLFPHTRSVQRLSGATSNTEWANEIKRDYLQRLVSVYQVGDKRMSELSNQEINRDLVSKAKILKHLKEKWEKSISI